MGFFIIQTTFRRAQFQAGWRVMGEGLLPAVETAWMTERAAALFRFVRYCAGENFKCRIFCLIDAGYAGEMKYLKIRAGWIRRESLPGVRALLFVPLTTIPAFHIQLR
jgi:hypothetical protein